MRDAGQRSLHQIGTRCPAGYAFAKDGRDDDGGAGGGRGGSDDRSDDSDDDNGGGRGGNGGSGRGGQTARAATTPPTTTMATTRGRGRGRGGSGDDNDDDSGRGRGRGGDDDDRAGGGTKVEISRGGIEAERGDGSKEEIEGGRYERKDASGRTVEERPATQADIDRLRGLAGPGVVAATRRVGSGSVAKVEISRAGIEVVNNDGSKEEIEDGRYERKDALGRTVEERPATQADVDRLQLVARGAPRSAGSTSARSPRSNGRRLGWRSSTPPAGRRRSRTGATSSRTRTATPSSSAS